MKIISQEIPLLPIAHSKRFQARGIEVKGDILADFGGISFYKVSKQKQSSVGNNMTTSELTQDSINLERDD